MFQAWSTELGGFILFLTGGTGGRFIASLLRYSICAFPVRREKRGIRAMNIFTTGGCFRA